MYFYVQKMFLEEEIRFCYNIDFVIESRNHCIVKNKPEGPLTLSAHYFSVRYHLLINIYFFLKRQKNAYAHEMGLCFAGPSTSITIPRDRDFTAVIRSLYRQFFSFSAVF